MKGRGSESAASVPKPARLRAAMAWKMSGRSILYTLAITLCHPPSVRIAISKVQRSPCHLSARARTFCRVPQCHSEKQSRSSSLQNSCLSSRAAKGATRSFTSARANSSFIAAPPRARPSPSREVFLENTLQLVPERREAPRQRAVASPPGQPLQGLIQGHSCQLAAERLPIQPLAHGPVFLEIRGPHRPPLLLGPLARGQAHQIERARAHGRRLPVVHDDPAVPRGSTKHEGPSEELAVDHKPRQRSQPHDTSRVAFQPSPHQHPLPGA